MSCICCVLAVFPLYTSTCTALMLRRCCFFNWTYRSYTPMKILNAPFWWCRWILFAVLKFRCRSRFRCYQIWWTWTLSQVLLNWKIYTPSIEFIFSEFSEMIMQINQVLLCAHLGIIKGGDILNLIICNCWNSEFCEPRSSLLMNLACLFGIMKCKHIHHFVLLQFLQRK